jgi:Ca-activated chloride channel family protein
LKLTGKITDSNNDAIIGANVFVSDSLGKLVNPPKGTSTDADGKYSLDVKLGDYVTATYVGTERQTIKANGSTLDFKLTESKDAALPEVIIEAERVYKKNYLGYILVGIGTITLITGVILIIKGK